MSGAWGCPHEIDNTCGKVNNLPCDPGMKGCALAGRYIFFGSDEKNERIRSQRQREIEKGAAEDGAPDDGAGE